MNYNKEDLAKIEEIKDHGRYSKPFENYSDEECLQAWEETEEMINRWGV